MQVLEQAEGFAEIGAGLQVTPNGARVLKALGVWPALEEKGLRALAVEPHDAISGRRLARLDLRGRGDWLFLHRADLIDVLAEAARGAGVRLRTGTRVAAVAAGSAFLESGEGIPAGLIVGADGIRSVVRRRLVGEEEATFTGQVAWRSLVDAAQEPVARIWMAPGRHAVTYPLRDGRLNLVAVREEAEWAEEGWSHRDSPDALRAAFADVAPALRAILDRVTEVGRWGLFRHPVAERWHDGRTAILGDAAHPTLPFLAQGANLALEDAWVLAREVMADDLEAGLDRYEHQRRARVRDAVAEAEANARRYHLGGPSRRATHLGLRALGAVYPRSLLRRLDWLYGFDATAED